MLIDLRLLIWLRWRHLKGDIRYWLRTIGIKTSDRSFTEQLYVLYVIVYAIIWLIVVWGYIAEQVFVLGQRITPETRQALAEAVPLFVFVAQIMLCARAIQSSPAKLSFEDISYIAGMPISRAAIVLVSFIQSVFPMAALSVIAATWSSMLFIHTRDAALNATMQVTAAAFPVAILLWACAWLIGCLRLMSPVMQQYRLGWVVLIGYAIIARLLPGLVLWPGLTLQSALLGDLASASVLAAILVALIAVIFLTWLGNRINMVDVADESAAYARIHALGLMVFVQPDLVREIRHQTSAKSRGPRARLLPGSGIMALLAKSTLLYIRLPEVLIRALFWGFITAVVGVGFAHQNATLPAWLTIGSVFVLLMPPASLITAFRLDQKEPFLRSLIPYNNLELITVDSALPALTMSVGAATGWLLMANLDVIGLSLIVGGVLLLVLAQAISLVRLPGFDFTVPYSAGAAIVFGLLIVLAFSQSVMFLPAGVLFIVTLGFGMLISL